MYDSKWTNAAWTKKHAAESCSLRVGQTSNNVQPCRVQLFEWKTQLNLNKNNWQYINCLFYVSQHRRALNQSRMARDFTTGNNRASIYCHFDWSEKNRSEIIWTLSDNKIMYEKRLTLYIRINLRSLWEKKSEHLFVCTKWKKKLK